MNDIRDAHYTLGKAYLSDTQYEEAITHFNSALKIAPDFIEAYHGLALAYFGQHKVQEAQNAARAALKIDENYRPALSLLQAIVVPILTPDTPIPDPQRVETPITEATPVPQKTEQKSVGESVPVKNTKPAAQSEPADDTDADRELERGLVFLNNKHYSQAEAAFKKVLKSNPQNAPAHYHLAQTYLEMDALNDAQKEVDTVLRLSPHYQPAKQLQTAITFVSKRNKRKQLQKKLKRYLFPLIIVVITGFIAFNLGWFSSLLPKKIPPDISIDALLEDPTNKNGYIDAGENVRIKLTITNSGSTAKGIKVRILPKSIGGLRIQIPDKTLNIQKNGFETIRIPITADKQARTKKVPISIQVLDKTQIPIATREFQLNIKSK